MTTLRILQMFAIISLSGCALKAQLLGQNSKNKRHHQSSSSSPDEPTKQEANQTLGNREKGQSASSSPQDSSNATGRGNIDRGALAYKDGRVYFTAWYVGDKAPEVVLKQGTTEIGRVPMRRSKSWSGISVCDGVLGDGRNGKTRYYKDCSIEVERTQGTYTLVVGQARHDFSIVDSRSGFAEASLIVAPMARAPSGRLNSSHGIFWHTMDLREESEHLQFVWLDGESVVGKSQKSVAGHKLSSPKSPVVDVIPAQFSHPNQQWGKGGEDLRLLVFSGGNRLVATLRIDAIHTTGATGKVGDLLLAADVSKGAIAKAKQVAEKLSGSRKALRRSETVVCAHVEETTARKHYADYRSYLGRSIDADRGARAAESKSKEKFRPRASKKEAATLAKQLKAQSAIHLRTSKQSYSKLEAAAKRYKKGCLSKLAPVPSR